MLFTAGAFILTGVSELLSAGRARNRELTVALGAGGRRRDSRPELPSGDARWLSGES